MTDWKLLGEVPDSEDEFDFDSQETNAPNFAIESDNPIDGQVLQDIWDVPDSGDELLPAEKQATPTPSAPQISATSSPLSSVLSLDDLPNLSQLGRSRTATQPSGQNSQRSQAVDLTGADEISNSYVQTTVTPPTQYGGGEDDSPSFPRPLSPKAASILPEQYLQDDIDNEAEAGEDEARIAAIRYERSLRPRKPIQEHPYLLENAHYSSLFKKHGVKPMQMAADIVRRRRENTYHDEEFRAPTQESALPVISEDSQRQHPVDFDPYDLNYMSSSPPKTSPWIHRADASSHPSSQIETDGTSVADGELPTVGELLLRPPKEKRARATPGSEARKRRRRNVIDSDPVEQFAGPGFEPIPQLKAKTPFPRVESPTPPSPRRPVDSPNRGNGALSEAGEATEGQQVGSESESDESVVVQDNTMNRMGKRIRGVLPASWLRLDEQFGRDKAQKDMNRRNRNRSPEREHRKGVAQVKQSKGAPTSTAWPIEESDDEPTIVQPDTTDDIYHNQHRLEIQPLPISSLPNHEDSSDDGSVIEQDTIDRMTSGPKRQLNISKSFSNGSNQWSSKKTSHGAGSLQRSKSVMSQSKISSFGRSHKSQSRRKTTSKHGGSSSRTTKSHKHRNVSTRSPKLVVPSLSILDVVEADAPRFVRIAARSAKRRKNQGRSSPSKKSIKLANRRDHVDAISVLNTWRAGQIQQRPAVSESTKQRRQAQRQPLSDATGNQQSRRPAARPSKRFATTSRKLAKHVSNGGSATYASNENATESAASGRIQPQPNPEPALSTAYRPAVMEQDDLNAHSRAFHFKKKFIDRIYRQPQRETTVDRALTPSAMDIDIDSSIVNEDGTSALEESVAHVQPQPRRRLRKTRQPQRIDVDAPQYSHAADPVPLTQLRREASDEVPLDAASLEKSKLRGLGSYGMQYPIHFEVFPLDNSVYFHESTLLGGDNIKQSISIAKHKRLLQHRTGVFFQLGQQSLHWSKWGDQVSSEIGILLDFVTEQLTTHPDGGWQFDLQTAVRASRFISSYAVQSMYFGAEGEIKLFITRALEVLHGFNERIARHHPSQVIGSSEQVSSLLRVFDSVLIVALVALSASQNDPNLMGEQFQCEALLTRMARQQMQLLLQAGDGLLKSDYESLTTVRARERGIRDDRPIMHSWVLIMKILDTAKVLRGSFWDVLQGLLTSQEVVTSTDVSVYENAWETMFLLLPLTEFNASGVILTDSRFHATSDGWIIPQKLLKRVFQLYSDNPRQPPSFNNYCRAIIGRCHYLVDQWGWRKSAPVVGVIFDFFGGQELAHLRNEEVHRSPQFLEDLADDPSLRIEPNDKCFHIFLKLLALSIQRLRQADATKDIRNLVARTMPNHNRQCLKEQNIHERDLAALRNHHDLLCTLFWASPKDLRPPVTLLERLVIPSSSHKEACLINNRAWSQLARFIVAKGEATTSFRPFMQWQTSFFQQTLHQFDSVASDIQQQLHSLSKEVVTSISRDMVDSMISMNKKAVGEVLGATVTASMGVLRHATDLESALFCVNTMQLQQVFKHFSITPHEFGWKVLREALSTLDTFIGLIDEFKDAEASQQTESQILNSAQADDALLVIEHDIARNYFGMARCIMSPEREGKAVVDFTTEKSDCVEATVILAARLTRRFIDGGLIRLPLAFKTGTYCLFDGQPHKLDPERRRYLVLFVATLLQLGIDDLSDLSFNVGELWVWSLVKPRRYLAYENLLAEQLRRRGELLVPDAVVGLSSIPDYSINRDLLEFALSALRRSLRDAGPSLKKILSQEHAQTLKFAMEQMKNDLHGIVSKHSEHQAYVIFVREVISLIRAHGAEICTIDDFFYQMSREYSPSTQDPQLQVAAMISYGLRIRDGDSKVVHQLFFFLFNNLKQSIINNHIGAEVKLLQKGLKDQGIFSFIVGKMLPAIITAACKDASAFCILDVYVTSLWRCLTRRSMSKDLSESLAQIATLFRTIQTGIDALFNADSRLTLEQLHVIRQMIRLMCLFWPTLTVELANNETRPGWDDIKQALQDFKTTFEGATAYLKGRIGVQSAVVTGGGLFGMMPVAMATARQTDQHVKSFADQITQDMVRNWTFSGGRINIQTAIKAKSGATISGIAQPFFSEEEVVGGLKEDLEDWLYHYNRAHGVLLPVETGGSVIIF